MINQKLNINIFKNNITSFIFKYIENYELNNEKNAVVNNSKNKNFYSNEYVQLIRDECFVE